MVNKIETKPSVSENAKKAKVAPTPKVGAEEPYAILTLRLFRRKGFEVDGEHIELIAPGHVYKIMPGVFREIRRIKARINFDSDRLVRAGREKALKLNEAEDHPVKKRIREIV